MAEHQPLKALLIVLNLIFLIVAVIFATIAATDENSGETVSAWYNTGLRAAWKPMSA